MAVEADRLRVLLTCEPESLDAMVAFYCRTLAFEREYAQEDDTGRLVGLRLDGTRLLLATPGAMGLTPSEPTSGATVILMHPDVAAHRRALTARFEGHLGSLQDLGGGLFYALSDPCGHTVWIMQVD